MSGAAIDGAQLRAILGAFRDLVTTHAGTLDRLNVFPVADADTGTNMARTLDAVMEAVATAGPTLDDVGTAAGRGVLLGARGNSGIILAQLLRGLIARLVDGDEVADALEAGAAAARRAVRKPVAGTMLTVADAAADAARRGCAAGGDTVAVLDAARAAADAAVAETPGLLPALAEAGVVDSGGAGLVLLFDAALHVLDGRPLPAEVAHASAPAPAHAPASPAPPGGPSHEVMFVMQIGAEALVGVKASWDELGDSIVVSGDESGWTCHVHTDDPDAVLAAARRGGARLERIRVEPLVIGPA